jgi:hypothetical protein
LSGNFQELGYSIEWHDFELERDLDWSRSFHPGGLEICLNLAGRAEVRADNDSLELGSSTAGFYAQTQAGLSGFRRGGERHRFVTMEFALPFLKSHATSHPGGLHGCLGGIFGDGRGPVVAMSEPLRLSSEQRQVALSLQHPPVYRAAQPLWYQAKALEIAATMLYQPWLGRSCSASG